LPAHWCHWAVAEAATDAVVLAAARISATASGTLSVFARPLGFDGF